MITKSPGTMAALILLSKKIIAIIHQLETPIWMNFLLPSLDKIFNLFIKEDTPMIKNTKTIDTNIPIILFKSCSPSINYKVYTIHNTINL